MNLKDLKNLDKDDLLAMLGLETRTTTAAWLTGTLGTFGLGLLVGAGIGLILAPKTGRELRENIRERIRRAPEELDSAVSGLSQRESISGGVGSKTY